MRYCRNCRKNVSDEFKFCPVCGAETEGSNEEILFPKEEIANLKHELNYTKDALYREIKFLKEGLNKKEPDTSSSVRLKTIHPIEFAYFTGTLGAIVGFIIGLFFATLMTSITAMLSPLTGVQQIGNPILIALVISVFYFVFGFIAGIIDALIYNFIASITGGIRITLSKAYDD
jgi:hypothetical protein